MSMHEPDDWYFDPELSRLRREWGSAYSAWDAVAERPEGVHEKPMTDEQRAKLRACYDAEVAYTAHFRKLSEAANHTSA